MQDHEASLESVVRTGHPEPPGLRVPRARRDRLARRAHRDHREPRVCGVTREKEEPPAHPAALDHQDNQVHMLHERKIGHPISRSTMVKIWGFQKCQLSLLQKLCVENMEI